MEGVLAMERILRRNDVDTKSRHEVLRLPIFCRAGVPHSLALVAWVVSPQGPKHPDSMHRFTFYRDAAVPPRARDPYPSGQASLSLNPVTRRALVGALHSPGRADNSSEGTGRPQHATK